MITTRRICWELMPPRFRGASPAEKCRKNKWKVGTRLKAYLRFGKNKIDCNQVWKITAIGIKDVMGVKLNILSTTEEIIPLTNPHLDWQLIKRGNLWDV